VTPGDGGRAVRISRRVPYAPEAVFDLVADIESYPAFVPWCRRTHIEARDGNVWRVYNEFGRGPLRVAFRSRAELDRPHKLVVTSTDHPFAHFLLAWTFEQAGTGTVYTFTLDQKFRSAVLEAAYGILFRELAQAVTAAFDRRARQTLGPAR